MELTLVGLQYSGECKPNKVLNSCSNGPNNFSGKTTFVNVIAVSKKNLSWGFDNAKFQKPEQLIRRKWNSPIDSQRFINRTIRSPKLLPTASATRINMLLRISLFINALWLIKRTKIINAEIWFTRSQTHLALINIHSHAFVLSRQNFRSVHQRLKLSIFIFSPKCYDEKNVFVFSIRRAAISVRIWFQRSASTCEKSQKEMLRSKFGVRDWCRQWNDLMSDLSFRYRWSAKIQIDVGTLLQRG